MVFLSAYGFCYSDNCCSVSLMSLSYAVSGWISAANTRFCFCFLDFVLRTALISASDSLYLSEYFSVGGGGVAVVQNDFVECCCAWWRRTEENLLL